MYVYNIPNTTYDTTTITNTILLHSYTVFKNKLLTKVDAQRNGQCHENRCIKRLSHLTVLLYQLGLFPLVNALVYVDIDQGIH